MPAARFEPRTAGSAPSVQDAPLATDSRVTVIDRKRATSDSDTQACRNFSFNEGHFRQSEG